MDNDRDIKFDIVIGHHQRSNSAFSAIFKMAAKTRHEELAVKSQHYQNVIRKVSTLMYEISTFP
jgi:hypothetical protein